MQDYEVFKPIRNFGLALTVLGALGIFFHFLLLHDSEYIISVQVFVVFTSIFCLFSGISIFSRRSWGFKNLTLCLYILYPCFPIGYYFAIKTFKYIKFYEIERFFRKSNII